MNELVTVRPRPKSEYTKKCGYRIIQIKNIQLYLNDLLNPEKYVLYMVGYRYIEIYQFAGGYKKFFGMIYKQKNKKKIYNLIETHIRIKDE